MNTTTQSDELLDRLDAAIAALEHLLAGIRPAPELRVLRGGSGLEQRPVNDPGR